MGVDEGGVGLELISVAGGRNAGAGRSNSKEAWGGDMRGVWSSGLQGLSKPKNSEHEEKRS